MREGTVCFPVEEVEITGKEIFRRVYPVLLPDADLCVGIIKRDCCFRSTGLRSRAPMKLPAKVQFD